MRPAQIRGASSTVDSKAIQSTMKSECVAITKSVAPPGAFPREPYHAERLEMSTDISRAELRRRSRPDLHRMRLSGRAALRRLARDHRAGIRYRITAYSPDIRREMIWLDHDRQALAAMIDCYQSITWTGTMAAPGGGGPIVAVGDDVRAVSSLAIFHTVVDVAMRTSTGSSRLFAVGATTMSCAHRRPMAPRGAHGAARHAQLGVGSHLVV